MISKITFALLLVNLAVATHMAAASNIHCVRTCTCTALGPMNEIYDVLCNVPDGDSWPGTYPNTSSLTILGEGLGNLDANVFNDFKTSQIHEGLANLRRLDLSNCDITSIDPDTFDGFLHLELLDLSNNTILGLTERHMEKINSAIILEGNDHQECIQLRQKLHRLSSGKTVVCGIHVPELTLPPLPKLSSTLPSTPSSTLSPTENNSSASLQTSAAPKLKHALSFWIMLIFSMSRVWEV